MTTLEQTISLIKILPEADLLKVQKFARDLQKTKVNLDPGLDPQIFPPLTREQLMKQLEISRQQFEHGESRNYQEVMQELQETYFASN